MKSIDYRTNNKGIGLIEVLVALLVIAIGLLAVASMQGNFLSGSADSKTRAEAQALAEQKIEEFRNNMVKGDYTAITNSGAPETIAGVNETFARSWTVNNLTPPDRKQLTVTVSWGGGGADQQIALSSEIAFSSPAASVAMANSPDDGSGSYGQAPNPGQNASETVDDETVEIFDSSNTLNPDFTSTTINGVTFYVDTNGNYYRLIGGGRFGEQVFLCSTLSQFEIDLSSPKNYDATTGDPLYDFDPDTGNFSPFNPDDDLAYLYTRRLSLDSAAGNEVIELFTQNITATKSGSTVTYSTDGTCTREHRYFGGVIIPIKGTVHTLFNLDDIKIDHNKEDMFCTFYAGTEQTSRHYACYVGGDCDVSTAGDESDVTQCPDPVAADIKVGPGGFSGNVGLINVDDEGAGKESVCFEEELEGTNTNFSTARKYKTLNAGFEQGINEPYNCQDFLIVGRQANINKLSAECSAKAMTLNLAPKEIIRTIISGPNTVVTTVNQNYCGDRVLTPYTLSVNFAGDIPTSAKTLTGTDCTLSSSTATCSESTYGKTARIYAKNSTQSGTCTITPLSLTTTNSCTINLVTTPVYTLTGTLTGSGSTPDMHVEDSFGNTGACIISSDTFSCKIGTSDTTITIQTQRTTGSKTTVVDYCTQVVAPNGSIDGTNTYANVCTLVKK